jgi:disulfide bond formation protein DsbB
MEKILRLLKQYALYIAFLQAWVATLGSLYYSEIKHLPPCTLCWYQRILMYPLIILLGVAIIRKDNNVIYYVLPFSIIGTMIALYQYLLQMTPLSEPSVISCDALGSCSDIQISYLGFITIPFLSLAAFVLISIMMILVLKSKSQK